jgi:hypothetical protein
MGRIGTLMPAQMLRPQIIIHKYQQLPKATIVDLFIKKKQDWINNSVGTQAVQWQNAENYSLPGLKAFLKDREYNTGSANRREQYVQQFNNYQREQGIERQDEEGIYKTLTPNSDNFRSAFL